MPSPLLCWYSLLSEKKKKKKSLFWLGLAMLYSPLKILCSREKDQKSPESKGVLSEVNVK